MTVDRRKEKAKKMKKKLRNRARQEQGTILPQMINENGQATVMLEKDGIEEEVEIRYLVAQSFVPNPDNKPFVIHKDGNKLNNRADNLAWSDVDED